MNWPKEVLKIQACRQETNNSEGCPFIVFAGHRVRVWIGIHKAHKDGITRKNHDLTKHMSCLMASLNFFWRGLSAILCSWWAIHRLLQGYAAFDILPRPVSARMESDG